MNARTRSQFRKLEAGVRLPAEAQSESGEIGRNRPRRIPAEVTSDKPNGSSGDRPILFSAPMVLALLAGRKTQTRRILKAAPGKQSKWLSADLLSKVPSVEVGDWDCGFGVSLTHPKGGPLGFVRCPYGKPGDRLWVRETWAAHWMYNDVPPTDARSTHPDDNYWFAADPEGTAGTHGCPSKGRIGKWRPSIHMPRWVSRLSLEVTHVRVERLTRITCGDSIEEGIEQAPPCPEQHEAWRDYSAPGAHGLRSPIGSYCSLWESINGAGSWAANPWVWAINFKLVTQ